MALGDGPSLRAVTSAEGLVRRDRGSGVFDPRAFASRPELAGRRRDPARTVGTRAAWPQGVGMNEEVTKTLLEWATEIKESVSAELPSLAREIVAYELWSAVAWMAVCVVTLWCTFVVGKKLRKKAAEDRFTVGDEVVVAMLCISGICASGGFLINVNFAIKAATAPRLVVVEKITKMLR